MRIRRRDILKLAALAPLIPSSAHAACNGEIVAGLVGALSGPAAALGSGMAAGIEAFFAAMNRAGGIRGRCLRLVALDDGYDPESAARRMVELLDQHRVVAVLGSVGTPTAERTVPIANERRVPLVGPFTGAEIVRWDAAGKPQPCVFNLRASYAEETAEMVTGLLKKGVRPNQIAFFTQADGYGEAGYRGAVQALKRAGYEGAERLARGTYSRNTLEIEDALITILNARERPRAIIAVGTYRPVARFIQLARKILPRTLFLNVSFVGSAALVGLLGAAGEGVIITQVVPPPSDRSIAAVRAYATDLEAYRKDLLPDFVSLEGYLVARLFVAALERAGLEPTRQSVLEALAGLTELDLGLGHSVGFPPGDHTLSPRRVWPTRVVVENGKPEIRPMRWDDLHVG